MVREGASNSHEAYKAPEVEESRFRQFSGPVAWFTTFVGAGLSLLIIFYVSGLLTWLTDFYFLDMQLNAIFVGGTLIITFLLVPAKKGMAHDSLPWYDIVLILTTIIVSAYPLIFAESLLYSPSLSANLLQFVLGLLAIILLLEAVRRNMGLAVVFIVAGFLLYGRYGYLLPGPLAIGEQSWDRIIAAFYTGMSGMFGGITTIGSNTIFAFIIFGVFLVKAGAADMFLNVALSLTGRFRGGPAKTAVLACALFGMISGSPSANSAVTGSISIPMMKKIGYQPSFASAVTAVAASGGEIMPPIMGGVAFIMAGLLQISYVEVARVAAIPAILFYIALYIQLDLRSAKMRLFGLPKSELPSFWEEFKKGWEFVIPLAVLLFTLFGLRWMPGLSAITATFTIPVVSMLRKQNRLNLKKIIQCLEQSTRNMMVVAPILAASGIIICVIGSTGIGPRFAASLVYLCGGFIPLLFLFCAITSYILGMAGAMVVAYILLAILVAPALELAEVPLIVAHFFIYYMAITMYFTPPVCPTVFITSGIANTEPFPAALQAMRLGIVAFVVPFMIMFRPGLLMIGTPLEIIQQTVEVLIGVVSLCIGFERYLFTDLDNFQTILVITGGLAMLIPGIVSNIIAIVFLAIVFVLQYRSRCVVKAKSVS